MAGVINKRMIEHVGTINMGNSDLFFGNSIENVSGFRRIGVVKLCVFVLCTKNHVILMKQNLAGESLLAIHLLKLKTASAGLLRLNYESKTFPGPLSKGPRRKRSGKHEQLP
jgi:hypothetical protein